MLGLNECELKVISMRVSSVNGMKPKQDTTRSYPRHPKSDRPCCPHRMCFPCTLRLLYNDAVSFYKRLDVHFEYWASEGVIKWMDRYISIEFTIFQQLSVPFGIPFSLGFYTSFSFSLFLVKHTLTFFRPLFRYWRVLCQKYIVTFALCIHLH